MHRYREPAWAQIFPEWIIVDLDGTLCDITHRLEWVIPPDEYHAKFTPKDEYKFVPDWKPNYDKFNSLCASDEIKWKVKGIVDMAQDAGRSVAIFTGREEKWRGKTMDWLSARNVKYDMLVMRPDKDYRSDDVIKREMFENRFNVKDIWFVLDDRDKVVKMWRDLGLTTLQVQKGDY